MAERSRWKPRLFEVLLLSLVVGILIGLLVPAIRAARRAARSAQRSNQLKQVGLAIHNFADVHKRLPPAVRRDEAGRTLSSWRFYILPFVEAFMMEVHFAERWDDPANRWFSSRPYCVFCWSAVNNEPESVNTNVVAITGPGTAFEGDRPIRIQDIPSHAILAIEIADSGIHWMEPGDLPIDQVPDSIAQGMEGEGVHVLFADASVWILRPDVPLEDLKKFFAIEGAKRYDRDQLLGPYSLHHR